MLLLRKFYNFIFISSTYNKLSFAESKFPISLLMSTDILYYSFLHTFNENR